MTTYQGQPVDVVIFCDGTAESARAGQQHPAQPIASYRLIGDGWLALHYGVFNGVEFPAQGMANLMAAGGPVAPSTVEIDGRSYFDVDAYAARRDEIAQRRAAAEDLRPHYRWHCNACGNDVDLNSEPAHRLMRVIAADPERTISLRRVQELLRKKRPT